MEAQPETAPNTDQRPSEPTLESEHSPLPSLTLKNFDLTNNAASNNSTRAVNTTNAKKGPTFDHKQQRLDKIISDSNKRRSRLQRDILSNGCAGKDLVIVSVGDGVSTQQYIDEIKEEQ